MYDITSTETSCSHDDEADVSSLDISVHQKKEEEVTMVHMKVRT